MERTPRITIRPYRRVADNWGPPGYYCIDGVDINLDAASLDTICGVFDPAGSWLRNLDDDALDSICDSYLRKKAENEELKKKQELFEARVINESSAML